MIVDMSKKVKSEPTVPSQHNWRTTDQDEINRRRERAQTEDFKITNIDPAHPVFSNFRVKSGSGLTYSVEVRDLAERQFSCECVDFRINGLGTCKHVEAVLFHLQGRYSRLFQAAAKKGSTRIEVMPDPLHDTLRLVNGHGPWPSALREWFNSDGRLIESAPETAAEALRKLAASQVPRLRVSQELEPWLQTRSQAAERKELRRQYEIKVQSGEWPAHETKVPLFPYQREGMLHLAFTERALLADEMGLGKTIQAIAACALLQRMDKARRVLVVTPASLKSEWEEQIQRFTALPCQLLYGGRMKRLAAYAGAPFFTIVNYEQMLADSLDVNNRLRPDIIVLDAGSGLRRLGLSLIEEFKHRPMELSLLITHTHWDHIQGFPFFLPAYNPKNNVTIYGYEGASQGLQSTLSSQMESPYFPISMQQMPGHIAIHELRDMSFNLNRVSVRAHFLNHPGICTGYRLSTPGGTICYLPDIELHQRLRDRWNTDTALVRIEDRATSPPEDRELVEFIRDTDVLIMDSQYDAAEYEKHIGWGHSCVEDSVAFALHANVKRLFLFHHDPDHTDEKISHMVARARQMVARRRSNLIVEAAREGFELVLAPKAQREG